MIAIAVTQNIIHLPHRDEYLDSLDHRWYQFLDLCGITYVPIPSGLALSADPIWAIDTWCRYFSITGFILSGGNDIGTQPLRDRLELLILDLSESRNLPVLGVCRGMQLMGYRSGVALTPVTAHAGQCHSIDMHNGRQVNSYHKYALSHVPSDYRLEAHSNDGVIESISHKSLSWQGIMWHPERFHEPSIYDISLLRNLF